MLTLYVGVTSVLELRGLRNTVDGAYINNGTVTVTLKDASGVAVTGETWPKTLTYVTASDGDYRAVLSGAMALTPGKQYTAILDTVGPNGELDHREVYIMAKVRRVL